MSAAGYPCEHALLISLIQAAQNVCKSTHHLLFAGQTDSREALHRLALMQMDLTVLEMILNEEVHPDLKIEVLEDQIDGEIALIDWDEIPRGDA